MPHPFGTAPSRTPSEWFAQNHPEKHKRLEISRLFLDLLKKYGTSRNGHAIYSPSGWKQWMLCSAALLRQLGFPDNAGQDAADGTVAHSLVEYFLARGVFDAVPGDKRVVRNGETDFTVHITAEMLSFCEEYIRFCQDDVEPGDVVHIEERVDTAFLFPIPDQKGTADYVVMRPGLLKLKDFKYGKGVRIYAEGNFQPVIYALAVVEEYQWLYSFETIELSICQPRLGVFETWTLTIDELLALIPTVVDKAIAAWDENAPFNPNPESCAFCKFGDHCEAKAQRFEAIVDASFDDDDVEFEPGLLVDDDPFTKPLRVRATPFLSTSYLVKLVSFQSWAEKWFHGARVELERRASRGDPVEGMKWVNGRGSRDFVSLIAADLALRENGVSGDDIYHFQMVSVAQAEKLLRGAGLKGKKLTAVLKELVVKTPGKMSLVPVADSRPEIADVVDDSFDGDDDGSDL